MKLAQLKAKAKREGWADWIRSEADERALLSGHVFDVEAAENAVKFFETFLYFPEGPDVGTPYRLLPWIKDHVLMPLEGWKNKHGLRRFRKGDVFVAKKQAKSFFSAGYVNYRLARGGPRTKVYGFAYDRDQAGIIYGHAAGFARVSPELKTRFKPLDSKRRILYKDKHSFYVAMAGENNAQGAEGIDPDCVIFDEIHVQRSRKLYDSITYASAAKPDSLMLSVSTVGVADITSIWWEQYEYAKGILSGEVHDDSRFAYVAQADEECATDWDLCGQPEQWHKAAPALGQTVPVEFYEQQYNEATNSPAKRGGFIRYLLNVPTAQITRVVAVEQWKKAAVKAMPDLSGQTCYGGLDLASHEDLTALVLYFPETDARKACSLCWAWCPEDKIRQREMRHMAFYRQWVDEGWLLETGGNRIDHKAIEMVVRQAFEEYDVRELAFDPWNADAVINPLLEEGYPVKQVPQTFMQLSSGTSQLLSDIQNEKILHDGNPVMTWCMANCAADEKEDAIKFSKDKSSDKIDLAVAFAMARGRSLVGAETEPQPQLFFG